MDVFMIAMRLIHVFSGVFWAGGAFFVTSIVVPTVQLAGPDGGRFMQRLAATGRMSKGLGIASILTALSGIAMYVPLFNSGGAGLFRTGPGIVLTIGALAGLLAFFHGFFGTRRVSDRMGALAREMLAKQGPPNPEQIQEAQRLGSRLANSGAQSAALLVVAVLCMATWRYF